MRAVESCTFLPANPVEIYSNRRGLSIVFPANNSDEDQIRPQHGTKESSHRNCVILEINLHTGYRSGSSIFSAVERTTTRTRREGFVF